MKITRFIHSCLLAEDGGNAILFDPGNYSWESGLFDINKIKKLDAVVITHEHPDHFYEPFINAIVKKFPDVWFITTPTVKKQLNEMAIKNVSSESAGSIQIFSKKPHAPNPPFKLTAPENIAVHFADRLTVGGDRHDLEETKEILALPVTAPWGSEKEAAQMLLRLKPAYMIPIHDWHWNEVARQKEYERFDKLCADNGIKFLWPTDGKPIEV